MGSRPVLIFWVVWTKVGEEFVLLVPRDYISPWTLHSACAQIETLEDVQDLIARVIGGSFGIKVILTPLAQHSIVAVGILINEMARLLGANPRQLSFRELTDDFHGSQLISKAEWLAKMRE